MKDSYGKRTRPTLFKLWYLMLLSGALNRTSNWQFGLPTSTLLSKPLSIYIIHYLASDILWWHRKQVTTKVLWLAVVIPLCHVSCSSGSRARHPGVGKRHFCIWEMWSLPRTLEFLILEIQKSQERAGEMAQHIRTLVFAEDLSSIPMMHHNHTWLKFQGIQYFLFFWLLLGQKVHT